MNEEIILRCLALLALIGLIAGCGNDIAMRNPRTGETVTCPQSLAGFDPWSQTDACAAARAEQGWAETGRPY